MEENRQLKLRGIFKMITKFSKFIFFYLAYLPLFLILLVLIFDIAWNLLYISLGVISLGFVLILSLFKSIKSLTPAPQEVYINSNNNSEVLGFIFTYLFPFLMVITNLNSIIAFSILIIMVFLIYIDTPIFSVNPLLKIILGYNVYEIKSEGKRFFLLSKEKYSEGKVDINVKQLSLEVLIEND
jgi:hypothetical protein